MGRKDNSNLQEQSEMGKDSSAFVEVLKLVVPALSAIVVAYFGYRQIIEPKNLEIAATQTAAATTQAALAITDMPTASVTLSNATTPSNAITLSSVVTPSTAATVSMIVSTPTEVATPQAAATAHPSPAIATEQPSPLLVTSATFSSSTPTASPTTGTMVMITTTEEEGSQVISVIPDTLRFQGEKVLGLRSGEFIPFTNILTINVGELKGDDVPIEITFNDGITLAATVEKNADFLEGATLHGAFQKNMYMLKQVELPNEVQSVPIPQPMVTITTLEGEVAQVIASTLRLQGENTLSLGSGENIQFTKLERIDIGELKGDDVPLEITFNDGTTLVAALEKYADFLEGATEYGTFQKNMFELKQVEFLNGP